MGRTNDKEDRNTENNKPIPRCKHERSKILGEILVNIEYENN